MFEFHCKGCTTYKKEGTEDVDFSLIYCADRSINIDGDCPCTRCVVKVMCLDPCDDYNDYVSELRDKGVIN